MHEEIAGKGAIGEFYSDCGYSNLPKSTDKHNTDLFFFSKQRNAVAGNSHRSVSRFRSDCQIAASGGKKWWRSGGHNTTGRVFSLSLLEKSEKLSSEASTMSVIN